MPTEISSLFEDVDYCRKQILIALESAGNRNTTRDQYDQIEKTLGLIYLYCPESFTSTALFAVEELSRRRPYFELGWFNNERKITEFCS